MSLRRLLVMAVVGFVVGAAAGYVLFARAFGELLSPDVVFLPGTRSGLLGNLNRAGARLSGLAEIRRNILISGIVGSVVAELGAVVLRPKKKKRRRR